jgi:hypothetical protein
MSLSSISKQESGEMEKNMDQYHIEMRSYRIIGWGWIALCAVGLIVVLLTQQYLLAGGCVVSAAFGAYMVLGSGSFDIDNEGLFHRSAFGAWQIRWDEISGVEVGAGEGTMMLHGNNKRFILSSPGGWDEAVKDEAFAFLSRQLESREIPFKASGVAACKIMKNTRVLPGKAA